MSVFFKRRAMSPAFSFVGFKYEFDTHDSLWLYPVNAAGLA